MTDSASGGAGADLNLPSIGLGTRLLLEEKCIAVIEKAIEVGYRYIDTAPVYENEAAIGAGLRRSGIAREEMFVTTKVERPDLRRSDLHASFERSLEKLQSPYVDLLLIHWPNEDVEIEETISAMCELQNRKVLRHIGVTNFPIALLDRAIESAASSGSKIAANQFELHPSLYQERLLRACEDRSVSCIAYSPMGRDDLQNPKVLEIASHLRRTPSQIVLRWHLQLGVMPIPIPDTATPEQVSQQFEIFDFALSGENMRSLSGLIPQTRYFNPAWAPKWDPAI